VHIAVIKNGITNISEKFSFSHFLTRFHTEGFFGVSFEGRMFGVF
jgi:hypothetical protein